MKVTVGGSYHEPGWTAVCDLVKKLKESGHEVLAPGEEWSPINKNAEFIKFKGEEDKSIKELQDGFFDKMEESDAYIVCNLNSYQGMAVSTEIGYATAIMLSKEPKKLKQIYFMNQPLGYELIKKNPSICIEDFEQQVRNDPQYKNELNYYQKFFDEVYTKFSDFYSDVWDFAAKVFFLERKGLATIGLDSILIAKKEKQQSDDEEER